MKGILSCGGGWRLWVVAGGGSGGEWRWQWWLWVVAGGGSGGCGGEWRWQWWQGVNMLHNSKRWG
ncbi:hypothetical protein HanIR_Chr04g0204771 [Helianthus annuus]|nr:hypothetical protein HanIR_Chr04g0204771 [Helianthus annuus]